MFARVQALSLDHAIPVHGQIVRWLGAYMLRNAVLLGLCWPLAGKKGGGRRFDRSRYADIGERGELELAPVNTTSEPSNQQILAPDPPETVQLIIGVLSFRQGDAWRRRDAIRLLDS